jgi:hypothetical protein
MKQRCSCPAVTGMPCSGTLGSKAFSFGIFERRIRKVRARWIFCDAEPMTPQ